MPDSARAKIWQIFGKMVFNDGSPPAEGESANHTMIDSRHGAPLIAPLRVLSWPCEVILFNIKKDLQTMTTSRRNPGKFMKYLTLTKKPLVLAIKAKAEACQRLLGIAAQADVLEGIRQGFEHREMGRARPAREALEEFRRNHAVPR
jgi:hypothetical protein